MKVLQPGIYVRGKKKKKGGQECVPRPPARQTGAQQGVRLPLTGWGKRRAWRWKIAKSCVQYKKVAN